MTLWSGRFDLPMDETLWDLSESYSFDHLLYAYDIIGSKAHVEGLVAAGLLDAAEASTLQATLDTIREEFDEGAFLRASSDEDVHTAIERRATELAGDVGAKLHTARSRNDQVATSLAPRCSSSPRSRRSASVKPTRTSRATRTSSGPSRCC
jgi:argininosuccinate lyase